MTQNDGEPCWPHDFGVHASIIFKRASEMATVCAAPKGQRAGFSAISAMHRDLNKARGQAQLITSLQRLSREGIMRTVLVARAEHESRHRPLAAAGRYRRADVSNLTKPPIVSQP